MKTNLTKFRELDVEIQSKIAQRILNNELGWEIKHKFKTPDKALEYYHKINIPVQNLIDKYPIFDLIINNLKINDQKNLPF